MASDSRRHVSLAFRLAVWAVALSAALVSWWSLVRSAAAPAGRLDMRTDFMSAHPNVSALKPNERLVKDGEGEASRQTVSSTPVYVDVRVPAGYERVTASFAVKSNAPIVEIGAMSMAGGEFLMRPGLNRNLEDLGWPTLTSGRLHLYQRTVIYQSLPSFFQNPPSLDRLAVYGRPELPKTALRGHEPYPERQELHLSLRGRHRMRVYLGGEKLDMEFALQDMNRAKGSDPVTVAVYGERGEGPLHEVSLPDDGDESDGQRSSGIRNLAVEWQPDHSGFYLLDIAASDDVFVRRIFTAQRRLGFVGRVHVGDQIGYWDQPNPLKVNVVGSSLAVKTPTVSGRQSLDINRQRMRVWEPMHLYEWVIDGSARFTVNERPLIIYTDGEIGLTDAVAPGEQLKYVTPRQTPAQDEMDGTWFIMADYGGAQALGGGEYRIQAEFDVSELGRTPDGAYRFLLWAPMQAEWGDLTVKEASFSWRRQPYSRVSQWWGQFRRDALAGTNPRDDITSPFGRIFDEYVP